MGDFKYWEVDITTLRTLFFCVRDIIFDMLAQKEQDNGIINLRLGVLNQVNRQMDQGFNKPMSYYIIQDNKLLAVSFEEWLENE